MHRTSDSPAWKPTSAIRDSGKFRSTFLEIGASDTPLEMTLAHSLQSSLLSLDSPNQDLALFSTPVETMRAVPDCQLRSPSNTIDQASELDADGSACQDVALFPGKRHSTDDFVKDAVQDDLYAAIRRNEETEQKMIQAARMLREQNELRHRAGALVHSDTLRKKLDEAKLYIASLKESSKHREQEMETIQQQSRILETTKIELDAQIDILVAEASDTKLQLEDAVAAKEELEKALDRSSQELADANAQASGRMLAHQHLIELHEHSEEKNRDLELRACAAEESARRWQQSAEKSHIELEQAHRALKTAERQHAMTEAENEMMRSNEVCSGDVRQHADRTLVLAMQQELSDMRQLQNRTEAETQQMVALLSTANDNVRYFKSELQKMTDTCWNQEIEVERLGGQCHNLRVDFQSKSHRPSESPLSPSQGNVSPEQRRSRPSKSPLSPSQGNVSPEQRRSRPSESPLSPSQGNESPEQWRSMLRPTQNAAPLVKDSAFSSTRRAGLLLSPKLKTALGRTSGDSEYELTVLNKEKDLVLSALMKNSSGRTLEEKRIACDHEARLQEIELKMRGLRLRGKRDQMEAPYRPHARKNAKIA